MTHRVLFVKPPDRFLENEFVYQQLGPHYLQSYLQVHGIESDLLVLYERLSIRKARASGILAALSLDDLNMLFLGADGRVVDDVFDVSVVGDYNVVGLSVMSPQAPPTDYAGFQSVEQHDVYRHLQLLPALPAFPGSGRVDTHPQLGATWRNSLSCSW